jgi:hypothetical protein
MAAPDVRTARVPAEPNADETTNTAPILAPCTEDSNAKLKTKYAARFANAGHCMYELASGGFLVSRWGHSRELPDLRAVIAFARQMGISA